MGILLDSDLCLSPFSAPAGKAGNEGADMDDGSVVDCSVSSIMSSSSWSDAPGGGGVVEGPASCCCSMTMSAAAAVLAGFLLILLRFLGGDMLMSVEEWMATMVVD